MVSNVDSSSSPTMYSMADDSKQNNFNMRRRHRRGGTGNGEGGDDNGSLTYSAGSSINSNGSSAAGESTDSSFADIMKYLDLPEGSAELEALMRKEGVDPRTIAKAKAATNKDAGSATSSLNYSTDGESNPLSGEHVLQTITGQPSDSFGPDGGGGGGSGGTHRIIFQEAEPVERKHRRKEGSKVRKHSKKHHSSPTTTTTRRQQPQRHQPQPHYVTPSDEETYSDHTPVGTPPPAPRRFATKSSTHEESITRKDEADYLYYAKWWMCGFADTLSGLVPKEHS